MTIPLLKLFTAKEGMKVYSEVLEFFAGLGYLENSNLPVYLRDGQTLTIWEGTTNVLSHDFYRSLKEKSNPLNSFNKFIGGILRDNV